MRAQHSGLVASGWLSTGLGCTNQHDNNGDAGSTQMSGIPICIDISHYQGFPDFADVKAAGVLGIIHKATEGTTYIDPNRAENCANALDAGLEVATYFWLKPGDARAQTEFYLETIQPQRGERVVIDYEEDGCELEMLHEAIQTLLDANLDLQITVYSGHLLKEQLEGICDNYLQDKTDLWLAQYTDDESDISWPAETYPSWTLWQYSETGEVAGIDDSYVDFNNYNGSSDDFLTWIRPAGTEPSPPTPEPDTKVVSVAITAPAGVKVEVTVNDTPLSRLAKLRRAARRGPDLAPGAMLPRKDKP